MIKFSLLVVAGVLSGSLAHAAPSTVTTGKQAGPVTMTDKQMDKVVAGEGVSVNFGHIVVEYVQQLNPGPPASTPPDPIDQAIGRSISAYIQALHSGGGGG